MAVNFSLKTSLSTLTDQLGTFRFLDADENEYEIWLPVFTENSYKICNPDD